MLCRSVAACALAAVVCWACDPLDARAGDVLRLGLNTEAPTLDLKGDGGVDDTLPVYRGYYGGGYGGYRGYYGGGYGGYGYHPYGWGGAAAVGAAALGAAAVGAAVVAPHCWTNSYGYQVCN